MNKNLIKVALTLILLVVSLIPSNIKCQERAENLYYSILEEYVDLHNNNLEAIPGIIKRIFANERVIFNIYNDFGDEVIGVVTSSDLEILKYVNENLEDPTMLIFIEGSLIDSLLANPSAGAVIEALNEIEIEGVGFFNKVKVFFIKILIGISGWFV